MGAVVIGVGTPSAQTKTEPNTPSPQATAQLVNAKNQEIGVATLTQTSQGVQIALNARNLPANSSLAFHVHQTGKCEGDKKFTTAGDHFNPMSKKHGHKADGGSHAGDMPNQQTAADGTLVATVVNSGITLDDNANTGIMKPGGTALILHAKADDYKSQPAGAAGDRIACGVITSVAGK
ncbi:MAG: superoxide dismutase family protein [Alphaproteobacteria bacterium]|nr:MAG: superoxide dismutase family protein [Alphaproteobacteria bacterium]